MIRIAFVLLLIVTFVGCQAQSGSSNAASDEQTSTHQTSSQRSANAKQPTSKRSNGQAVKRLAKPKPDHPDQGKQTVSKVDIKQDEFELLPFKLDDYSDF